MPATPPPLKWADWAPPGPMPYAYLEMPKKGQMMAVVKAHAVPYYPGTEPVPVEAHVAFRNHKDNSYATDVILSSAEEIDYMIQGLLEAKRMLWPDASAEVLPIQEHVLALEWIRAHAEREEDEIHGLNALRLHRQLVEIEEVAARALRYIAPPGGPEAPTTC